ncbi:hypothetical protein [Vibrio lentus]|uniref:hypothetical protein n=1 Tax=Vibrio lentus TaxID=136468 RepID=UPI0010BDE3A0|nr:hypothetical protein [Vibrio lentus]TKG17740.1 hypothetical protein FCW05_12600 [Vibrio lentus]
MNQNTIEHLNKVHTKKVVSGGNVQDADALLQELRIKTGLEQAPVKEVPVFPEITKQQPKEPEWVGLQVKHSKTDPREEKAFEEMDSNPAMERGVKAMLEIADALADEINDSSSPITEQTAPFEMIRLLEEQKDSILGKEAK